jgi:uncharacterized damage-inducible protein DinB
MDESQVDHPQIDEQGRPEPPRDAGESATLLGFLDYQRATFEWKCRGLTDEQLRIILPPTTMTLGGMLKHLALNEDYWCSEVAGGQPTPEPWASRRDDPDPDWDWHSAAQDTGEELRALWAERVDRSRRVVNALLGSEGTDALATIHPAWDGQGRVSLRWVLVHLIEEYARHNGHADLIRESIDGATGE